MTSQRVFRAGIIGLGFIGGGDQVSGDALGQQVSDLDGTHFSALAGHPQIHLAAGASRDAGRRARFAERASELRRAEGVRTYADWREMLESEPLDIVSVASYAPQHAEMVLACAERKIPAIYCEKPLATRLRDADQMLEACLRSGSQLVINHNRRFNPMYHQLRKLVLGGELGELTSGAVQWGTGRLGNVGTHLFDTLRMTVGREVTAVSGTLDATGRPDCRGPMFRDPGGWGVLRMEGGLHVTVDAGDSSRVPATLVLNGTLGRATTGGKNVVIEFWNGQTKTSDVDVSGPRKTSMDRAVAEIVEHLCGRATFPWRPEEALRTLEVIVGFHVSHARNGAWVDLPLTGADRDVEVHSG